MKFRLISYKKQILALNKDPPAPSSWSKLIEFVSSIWTKSLPTVGSERSLRLQFKDCQNFKFYFLTSQKTVDIKTKVIKIEWTLKNCFFCQCEQNVLSLVLDLGPFQEVMMAQKASNKNLTNGLLYHGSKISLIEGKKKFIPRKNSLWKKEWWEYTDFQKITAVFFLFQVLSFNFLKNVTHLYWYWWGSYWNKSLAKPPEFQKLNNKQSAHTNLCFRIFSPGSQNESAT